MKNAYKLIMDKTKYKRQTFQQSWIVVPRFMVSKSTNHATSKMKHFSAIVAKSCNLNVAELLFPTFHCKIGLFCTLAKPVSWFKPRKKLSKEETIKTVALEPYFIKVISLWRRVPRHLLRLGNCEYFTTWTNCFLNEKVISAMQLIMVA